MVKQLVLIVDDEPKNIKLLDDLLQMAGYGTITAADGRQGLALAREHRPDLILMDVQMPVMDGLTATGELKSDPATRDIPVVALTALAMEGDRERILEAGCDDYISKPISIKPLLERLRGYLKKREQQDD